MIKAGFIPFRGKGIRFFQHREWGLYFVLKGQKEAADAAGAARDCRGVIAREGLQAGALVESAAAVPLRRIDLGAIVDYLEVLRHDPCKV
jgi:hypothetical protein